MGRRRPVLRHRAALRARALRAAAGRWRCAGGPGTSTRSAPRWGACSTRSDAAGVRDTDGFDGAARRTAGCGTSAATAYGGRCRRASTGSAWTGSTSSLLHDAEGHADAAIAQAYPGPARAARRGSRRRGRRGSEATCAFLHRFVVECRPDVVLVAGRYTLLEQPARGRPAAGVRRGAASRCSPPGCSTAGCSPSRSRTADCRTSTAPAPATLVARAGALAEACGRARHVAAGRGARVRRRAPGGGGGRRRRGLARTGAAQRRPRRRRRRRTTCGRRCGPKGCCDDRRRPPPPLACRRTATPGSTSRPWPRSGARSPRPTCGRAIAGTDVRRTVLVEGGRCDRAEAAVLLDHARATPEIAGVVAWADPASPDLPAVLRGYRALPGGERLVGIRAQVQAEERDYLDRAGRAPRAATPSAPPVWRSTWWCGPTSCRRRPGPPATCRTCGSCSTTSASRAIRAGAAGFAEWRGRHRAARRRART